MLIHRFIFILETFQFGDFDYTEILIKVCSSALLNQPTWRSTASNRERPSLVCNWILMYIQKARYLKGSLIKSESQNTSNWIRFHLAAHMHILYSLAGKSTWWSKDFSDVSIVEPFSSTPSLPCPSVLDSWVIEVQSGYWVTMSSLFWKGKCWLKTLNLFFSSRLAQ